MLLFIAFVCFALLFAGWIMAPNTSAAETERPIEPAGMMPEPGTSPA